MCLLKQTRIIDKTPLTFESRSLMAEKLNIVKNKLYLEDWYCLLNSNALDEVAPVRTFKVLAQRRFVEPWMSKNLESSSRTKMQLYKDTLKKDATNTDRFIRITEIFIIDLKGR